MPRGRKSQISGKLPEEVKIKIKEDEQKEKAKNKLNILKVIENETDSESEPLSKKLKTADPDSEEDDGASSVNSFKKKNNVKNKRKIKTEEEVIEDYLEEFKRSYDLKINNYFKQYNSSLNVLENKIMENFMNLNSKLDILIVKKEKEFGSRYAVNPSDSIIWENSYSSDLSSNGCNFGYQNNKLLTTEFKIGSEKKYSTDTLSQNYEHLKTSISSGIDKISMRSVPNFVKKENNVIVNYDRMLELAEEAHSIPNLAVRLLNEFFDESELCDEVNVRGQTLNGAPPKKALDPERIEKIKKFCLDQDTSGIDRDVIWRSCVNAMNKKIASFKNLRKSPK